MDKILSTSAQHSFPLHVINKHRTCHKKQSKPGIQKPVPDHLPEHGQPYICGLVIVKPGYQIPSYRADKLGSACADAHHPEDHLHQYGCRPSH